MLDLVNDRTGRGNPSAVLGPDAGRIHAEFDTLVTAHYFSPTFRQWNGHRGTQARSPP